MLTAIIMRIKAWLRSFLEEKPEFGMAQPQTIPEAAGHLVERSRQGDQNAIAMICQIRDAANRGEARAKATASAIMNYIKRNPATQMGGEGSTMDHCDAMANDILDCFGAELPYQDILVQKVIPLAEANVKKAIVTVAQGPILFASGDGESLVRRVGEALPEGQVREAYRLGATDAAAAMDVMKNVRDLGHDAEHALLLGYVLGKARQLQLVRIPNVPIGVQSELASFELD